MFDDNKLVSLGGGNMPIQLKETTEFVPKRFGKVSPERNKILGVIKKGLYYTTQELSKLTNIDSTVLKTRCSVMFRDKLLVRASNKKNDVVYTTTMKGHDRLKEN